MQLAEWRVLLLWTQQNGVSCLVFVYMLYVAASILVCILNTVQYMRVASNWLYTVAKVKVVDHNPQNVKLFL